MIHQRKYMRLHGWDYSSPGSYFVTICVKNKECFLADIVGGRAIPNEYGKIVESRWQWLESQNPYVGLDGFVVMPNHVHGLVRITGNSVVTGRDLSRKESDRRTNNDSVVTGRDLSLPTIPLLATMPSLPTIPALPTISTKPAREKIKSLSDIIGAFKTTSSKDIHLAGFPNFFWQRSFYEKIIRSEQEAGAIRHYIRDNPSNWDRDDENPLNKNL